MRTVRTVAELRTALRPARQAEQAIGLVPTMGALHAGHAALIDRAREECDEVVVSLFVNPAQFNEQADLDGYPRDEAADAELAAAHGADVLFAPPADVVYPAGFASQVRVGGPLVEALEGVHRGPEHFHGVTTVVAKLLNMAQPTVAYFGQKDAQQALVVQRMATDLDMPVRIQVVPTVREPDGLALSSRNVRLRDGERTQALALSKALRAADDAYGDGERGAAPILSAAHAAMTDSHVEPEYLALVDPRTLAPVAAIDEPALLAVAARVGDVRLIDNTTLGPSPQSDPAGSPR